MERLYLKLSHVVAGPGHIWRFPPLGSFSDGCGTALVLFGEAPGGCLIFGRMSNQEFMDRIKPIESEKEEKKD